MARVYAPATAEMAKLKKENDDLMRSDWLDANQANLNKISGCSGDGIFECVRCKSKNVTFTQKQTRSADEPMVRLPRP